VHDIHFQTESRSRSRPNFLDLFGPWPGRRPKTGPAVPVRCHTVLGRTHMCLLAYWRTGLLVFIQGSWYYVYVSYATNAGTNGPQPAPATTKKLRPGRGRPRHKKRAAVGRNCGRPRLCGRLRPTGPDVMHWCAPSAVPVASRYNLKMKMIQVLQ
jgi:hypothetical protein